MTEQPLDAIEALLPAYALNALEDEDRALVEGALAQEARYREQLAEYLGTVAQLSATLPAAVPSAALRQRVVTSRPPVPTAVPEVFNRSSKDESERKKPRRVWNVAGPWAAAAALLLAVVGVGSFTVSQQQQLQDLRLQMDNLAANLEETEDRLIAQQALVYWIAQPEVSTITLRATNLPNPLVGLVPSQEARALVMRSPFGETVLVAINLPPLPEHLSYQAWAWSSQGRPYSLGIFEVDEHGYAQVMMDYPYHAGDVYVLSVTVEPAGGSATPSQRPPVLQGIAEVR